MRSNSAQCLPCDLVPACLPAAGLPACLPGSHAHARPTGSPLPALFALPPCRLADLAEARVPGSGRAWKKTWEKAWQANLNSCTLQDECTVQLA